MCIYHGLRKDDADAGEYEPILPRPVWAKVLALIHFVLLEQTVLSSSYMSARTVHAIPNGPALCVEKVLARVYM